MAWMILPYRRYAEFSGRSRRKEYWMFILFTVLVYCVLFGLILAGVRTDPDVATEPAMGVLAAAGSILLGVFVLGSIIPTLALTVRRLHDSDKSGWLILVQFIPYVGSIILLVLMCLDGTRGENSYGFDPKEGPGYDDVFA
jgi:uncharacterized membrane protein YhaH (DUF805 family)